MVPHVKSADEARWVVRNAKFHPQGLRGIDCVEPAADFGLTPLPDYIRAVNQETFIVVQIEDKEALDEIDAIAAVPGVDVLFIGAADLTQSLGIPGQFDHPEIRKARGKVAEAAAKHGKWWGCPASAEEAERLHREEGASFFGGCAVLWVVLDGLRQIRSDFTRRLGD
jgi:2-keto-3-deoxy-L-rhamnonate aldolase RhmA